MHAGGEEKKQTQMTRGHKQTSQMVKWLDLCSSFFSLTGEKWIKKYNKETQETCFTTIIWKEENMYKIYL